VELDFHLVKQMPSVNENPEDDFRLYDAHLDNRYHRIATKNDMPITIHLGQN